jgi:hypothetical protein
MNNIVHSMSSFKGRLTHILGVIGSHIQQHGLYLLCTVIVVAGYLVTIELTFKKSMKRPGQISLRTPHAVALTERAWVFEAESFVVVGKNGSVPSQPYMYRTWDSDGVINSGLVMTLKNKLGAKFYLEYHSDLSDEIMIGSKTFKLMEGRMFLVDQAVKTPERTIRQILHFEYPTRRYIRAGSAEIWLSVPELSKFIKDN